MVFYGELAYGLRAGVYGTIYHIGWGRESGYPRTGKHELAPLVLKLRECPPFRYS